ncbi:MAG: PAS domain-containing protein [Desulfobacteraceae bacterium]|nr:PAS domain-containing protein [Desulfobacteraceae bacterium]
MARKKKTMDKPGDTSDISTRDPQTAVEVASGARPGPNEKFPVVGIGASAGGLAAFEAFFSGIPADIDTGMAFVLVQHLAPNHKSILTDLIRRYTSMKVFEVEDGMKVCRNCAYIIPPGRDMAFLGGTLHLLEPFAPRGLRMPIDFFFRSLAQDQHDRAIGIVLSGTGSDGTAGVRAIKGEGGMVMAQNPYSAEYDSMPLSAIATGLVDYELAPAEMPAQIMAYVAHAFKLPAHTVSSGSSRMDNALKKIFILLRAQTGHDFSGYKPSTIHRRILRRMAMHQIDTLAGYVTYAQKTPVELEHLFRDLLIGVTRFFRDPEAFNSLETKIIPKLFADKPMDGLIRVWVAGCSTGEEAYSLAILLAEQQEALKCGVKVQIFATDIDSHAIATARNGRYPASIAEDISPSRLARFFSIEPGNVFRIHKTLRDLLIFSEQDVIKDPPFSRIDLISCRNLMIYMGGDLQKKLIALFHYALNPAGFLFLGTSETVGELGEQFSTKDRKQKIYQRKENLYGTQQSAMSKFLLPMTDKDMTPPHAGKKTTGPVKLSVRELTEQTLLQMAPAAAMVNSHGDILYLHGRTGMYLELSPGEAGVNNILKMAREGLQQHLTKALHKVAAGQKMASYPRLHVKTNGDFSIVNLTVRSVTPRRGEAVVPPLYLVIFTKEETPPATEPVLSKDFSIETGMDVVVRDETQDQALIKALQQELKMKEEYLQATHEELETSNEELKSSNEEMQSVNEELQSTNEELETSKEELQSVNEELSTVNAELQAKVIDLSRSNNDMNNLLAGTGIATVFVDCSLCILRFTPAATRIINLIHGDIGRPIGHTVSNLEGVTDLTADIQSVLNTLSPKESQVKTNTGEWYIMRILPYRTLENDIEGAVLTFVDISDRKKAEEALLEAKEREIKGRMAVAIVDTVREPMLVLDENLRVVSANQSFYSTFQVNPGDAIGRLLNDLGNGQWNIPSLLTLLNKILPQNSVFNDYELTHNFERIGPRTILLNARRIVGTSGKTGLILLAMEDITKRRKRNPANHGGNQKSQRLRKTQPFSDNCSE